ncbi:MAG: glycosyltransferase family 1 protein [Lachnospiraceae bacterium]|nr:glycosyltransferase family 1 protein [Lachnospiraceae bacterium]
MIRVLQVLEGINENSGVSSVVMNYYDHMETEKIMFDFMIHSDIREDTRREIEKRGSKIYRMPSLSGKNIPRYIKALNRFWEEHRGEYQIVHGHLPNAAVFYLGIAGKYGCPVRILHSHNSRGADGTVKRIRNYILNRWGVRTANTYFACSKLAAEYLFGKRKAEKAHIIYNAIELKKFAYNPQIRQELRRKYHVEDKVVIGHVGRFQEQKNHTFIIELAQNLAKKQEYVFVLLGDGPLRKNIEQSIERCDLQDQVKILGVVKNPQDYYQMMDIFILPSLYEGLPVVGVEAQAAGLSCILSDRITEEVLVAENIHRLSIADAAAWAEKIREMTDDRVANMQRLEEAGFSIEREALRLEQLYQNIVEGAYGKNRGLCGNA